MKPSLLISGIAELQKNRLHGTIETVLLLIVQVFNSFNISPLNILLKGGKKSCLPLSTWVSLVDMGRSRLRSKADLTPRLSV